MANIKVTPQDCQFFIETDPYNFETDNRPLTNLLNNDILLNAELEAVRNEVTQARSGIISNYDTLDLRLDAMEGSIGVSVSVEDMENIQGHQYGDFIANSEALRRATPSGFLDHGGIADLNVGDDYDDFAGIRTTQSLGASYTNTIVLWTAWGSYYKPIRTLVNGWVVRLFNEKVGTPPVTPANHITIHLGSAPATGKYTNFAFLEVWLEEVDKINPVFYRYGAVGSNAATITNADGEHPHLHPDVIHTVKAMAPGGNWIQLRHRIRVIQDVDPNVDTHGYNSAIFAQGPNSNPINGYVYSNMAETIDDPGLWRTGSGDTQSIADLNTYDGYLYSIPIKLGHRRNSGVFSVTNQNGAAKNGVPSSGTMSSAVSGRPDGLYYDGVDQRDILDLRNRISLSGFNYQAEMDRTWQMLIRGELRTGWKELLYDYDNDNTWAGAGIWGHTLTVVDQITNNVSLNPDQLTNPLRDRQVTTAPLSYPDGQRNIWGRNATLQYIKFSFTEGTNVSAAPSGFVTYNKDSQTLTFNSAALSGNGTGGTKIGMSPPIIMKKSSLASKPTLISQGLGTQTATTKMGGLTSSADYVGFIQVVYPGGSGISFPHKTVLSHEVMDNGTVSYLSEQFGITGTPSTDYLSSPRQITKTSDGKYIVADKYNHRIIRIDPTTWVIDAQFGVTGEDGIAFPDNSHLSEPVGVVVAPDNSVWVCDTGLHRVIKLNSLLNYQNQFGVTNVSGSDNTHCNSPRYITVDPTKYNLGTGGVYFSDCYNHRVVELAPNLTKQDQFGVTGTKGSGSFGLFNPTGVAFVNAGFGTGIWVSDTDNRRVVVLDSSMNFQYQICDYGNTSTLYHPSITDTAIDSSGNIYISVSGENAVYKYNQYFSKVGQFGTGSPGTDNLHLNRPSGIALDQANGWLYVADHDNHRLIRLNMNQDVNGKLPYLTQFGTGKVSGTNINVLCPYASDVAVDAVGNVYVLCNEVHQALKLNSSLVFQSRFGVFGDPGPTIPDNLHLRNPVGLAVNTDGSIVMVVDVNNHRIVKLNGSNMTYASSFVPTYDTSALSLEIPTGGGSMWDMEYSPAVAGDGAGWWLTVREIPRGSNGTVYQFAILKFSDTPVGTPNYIRRVVSYDWTVGITVTDTKILGGTSGHGVIFLDRVVADPNNPNVPYYYTVDPINSIFFKFIYPTGIYSDGTKVLVSEPQAHVVHCFDSDAGIYKGSAGVMFEPGDDDAKLNTPHFAMLDGERILISDTRNHRLLRRHVSSPWVSSDGTVSSMVAPSTTDKIFIFYETEAYQGVLNQFSGIDAIFKSQIKHTSQVIFATTMGLGNPLTPIYQEFKSLSGLTVRLPLPSGWKDYDIAPVGLKIGTTESEDDGPFLSVPVVVSEGFMGGQFLTQQRGLSNLTSAQSLQQVVRTIGGEYDPHNRGFRSLLPNDRNKLVTSSKVESGGRVILSPIIPPSINPPPGVPPIEVIRYGVPPVRSYNLLEAVPHFNYYPFFYQRKGVLYLAVIAEATNSRTISVGSYDQNSIDIFLPQGRILTR